MAVDEQDKVESKSLDRGADRASDDSRESLSQSIWDDIKSTVSSAIGLSDRAGSEPASGVLDFGEADPYSSKGDSGRNRTTSDSRDSGPGASPDANMDRAAATDNMARDAGGAGARSGGDRPAEAPRQGNEASLAAIHDNADVTRERGRLETDLASKVPDEAARERIRQNMESFEQRSASMTPPLSPEEVAKTYREVTRLLEARDNPDMPSITAADRVVLAEQITYHAARPETIDQGAHATCSVATLENRMFSRNPSAAAELIRQVATEGQYVTHGEPPRTVEMSIDSLTRHPGGEESRNPPQDGQRSYASQIFQVTAVNVHYQSNELRTRDSEGNETVYPPGTVEYVQRDPLAGGRPPTTGELLVDRRTGDPIQDRGANIDSPNLNDDPQVDIYNEIAGTRPPERGMVLVNDGMLAGAGDRVTHLSSEQQLRSEIERAQSEGRLPIILKVQSAGEPFFSDSGGGRAGGSGGAHVVCITGFDAQTGNVQIDNQWGHDSDHPINISELYRATMPREQQHEALQRECADAAAAGRPDHGKELQMLRLGRGLDTDEMNDAEFDRHAIWLMQNIVRDAQQNHNGQIDERTRTEMVSLIMDATGDPERLQRYQRDLRHNVCGAIDSGNVGNVEVPAWYGRNLMQDRAEGIEDAVHWYGNNTDAICENLERLTPAEYHQMDQIFRQSHDGKSIEQYLTEEMSDPQERERAMTLIRQARRDQPRAS